MATVALAMVGFWAMELNPLGPDHVYVAPAMVLANKVMVPLVVTGELLVATGAAGAVVTVISIELEVTVFTVLQAALDVTSQVTTLLLASVEVMKVLEFVPALVPFTFH
jgi:hypothetical protein